MPDVILVNLTGKAGEGLSAIVDADDFAAVSNHNWYHLTGPGSLTVYARSQIDGVMVTLHSFIMGKNPGFEIDHIDGNGLNNSRSNLRFVTHSENMKHAYARKKMVEAGAAFDAFEASL